MRFPFRSYLQKPLVMGILNVTPDSFSDGGRYFSLAAAVRHGLKMVRDGACIIDVGGESTGPDSVAVSEVEERRRVIPVIKKLAAVLPKEVMISIDTWKATVAAEALKAGAQIVNDVTALRGDPKMVEVVSTAHCPVVLMYAKDATPRTTREKRQYDDVVATIKVFLEERMAFALKYGIHQKNIILDPGMGAFVSGDPRYSFEILGRLREFAQLGRPFLIGVSRKSFLGGDVTERLKAGVACEMLAVANGASIIRTHDVAATVHALS